MLLHAKWIRQQTYDLIIYKRKIETQRPLSKEIRMDSLVTKSENLCVSRISRAQLDTTKCYIKVRQIDGKDVEEKVGQFIRSYTMGSGDGTTVHWEFKLNGKVTTESDEMFGSVSGVELTWYKIDADATEELEKDTLNKFVSDKFKCGTLPVWVSERTLELRRQQMEEAKKGYH